MIKEGVWEDVGVKRLQALYLTVHASTPLACPCHLAQILCLLMGLMASQISFGLMGRVKRVVFSEAEAQN